RHTRFSRDWSSDVCSSDLAALGSGIGNMIIAISITWWPAYARLIRGEVMVKKEEQFVTAARALGAGSARILGRHILPNIVSPVRSEERRVGKEGGGRRARE